MKIESIEGWDKRANGTCLQGYINGSFQELVDTLGPPIGGHDEYKTDAEWLLILNDNTAATIYNYKTGQNYLGEDGEDVEDITTWHVGGKSSDVVYLLDGHFEEVGAHLSITSDRW